MPTCVVVGCTMRATKANSARGIRLHRFPRNSHRRRLWVEAINRENWTATDNDRICGLHFHSGYPIPNVANVDFVPSLFPSPTLQSKHQKRKSCKKTIAILPNYIYLPNNSDVSFYL